MKPVVLVTGAAGFTARHLLPRLRSDAGVLVGADVVPQSDSAASADELVALDLLDAASVDALAARLRPAIVYHLAGRGSGTAEELWRSNAVATRILLECVRRHAPDARVLVVGSAAEYGRVDEGDLPVRESHRARPVSDYGRAKHAATSAALEFARDGMRVLAVRPFNLVGAGVPPTLLVGALVQRAAEALRTGGTDVAVGNLETERDFLHVEDAVEAYAAAIAAQVWGRVFNICSGSPTRVGAVVERLLACADPRLHAVPDPTLVRRDDVRVSYGSTDAARVAFGFSPKRSLDDALREAWDARPRQAATP